jgi:hypothetical protein
MVVLTFYEVESETEILSKSKVQDPDFQKVNSPDHLRTK